MLQQRLFKPSISERFAKFHADNPAVYAELVRLARDLKAKGYKHYSCDSLLHVIRFHRHLVTTPDGSGFEINNDFAALFSRLIMQQEKDLEGFFELRERRAA